MGHEADRSEPVRLRGFSSAERELSKTAFYMLETICPDAKYRCQNTDRVRKNMEKLFPLCLINTKLNLRLLLRKMNPEYCAFMGSSSPF